jgi:hypothetical protein
MRANPYSLELNYRFQDRRGLTKNKSADIYTDLLLVNFLKVNYSFDEL